MASGYSNPRSTREEGNLLRKLIEEDDQKATRLQTQHDTQKWHTDVQVSSSRPYQMHAVGYNHQGDKSTRQNFQVVSEAGHLKREDHQYLLGAQHGQYHMATGQGRLLAEQRQHIPGRGDRSTAGYEPAAESRVQSGARYFKSEPRLQHHNTQKEYYYRIPAQPSLLKHQQHQMPKQQHHEYRHKPEPMFLQNQKFQQQQQSYGQQNLEYQEGMTSSTTDLVSTSQRQIVNQDHHEEQNRNISKEEKKKRLLEELCTPSDSNPNLYLACTKMTFTDDKNLRKMKIGQENATRNQQNKVILLLGETGSGKSTLINAMFNYVMGVEFQDDFRANLIGNENSEGEETLNQAKSQTKWITSYTIYPQDSFTVPFKLTIIDTPGFGDTAGYLRDQEITEQIRQFFNTKDRNGIDAIDAVGFVAKSSQSRLTPTQRYIFDSILSLFGKDIEENIFMLLPFSDGGEPEVLSALKEAKVPYQQYFDFNNKDFFSEKRKKTSMMKSFWEMSKKSFEDFMGVLEGVQTKSLTLTKEVLQRRKELEEALSLVQRNIGLNTQLLKQLHYEQEVLQKHQSDIDKNKNFTYKSYEQYVELERTRPGIMAINCHNCNVTCLTSGYYGEKNLTSCYLFGNGRCVNCPKQCRGSDHKSEMKEYIFKVGWVTKTHEHLLKKYEEAKGKKRNSKQMIKKSQQQIEKVQKETLKFVFAARGCIARLGDIALKPNIMSGADYINLLIENDKHQGGTKVNLLTELKRKAQEQAAMAENLMDKNFDPFEGSTLTYEVEMKEQDGKPFGKVKKFFKKIIPGKK